MTVLEVLERKAVRERADNPRPEKSRMLGVVTPLRTARYHADKRLLKYGVLFAMFVAVALEYIF